MLQGAYKSVKKDGSVYYRANISFRGKHISLGSAETEAQCHAIYSDALSLISWLDEEAAQSLSPSLRISTAFLGFPALKYDKIVTITNYHDNGIYLGTPIYLMKGYFIYYLDAVTELKFDADDLFYYSNHRLLSRGGHLFVNEYGMQTGILSRYGIRPHAVKGTDYIFVNGDETDYRYENIKNINPWNGVSLQNNAGRISYLCRIHIDGYWQIGIFENEIYAAVAYNKAADTANALGLNKDYQKNYITELSSQEYREIYKSIKIPKKLRDFLAQRL